MNSNLMKFVSRVSLRTVKNSCSSLTIEETSKMLNSEESYQLKL